MHKVSLLSRKCVFQTVHLYSFPPTFCWSDAWQGVLGAITLISLLASLHSLSSALRSQRDFQDTWKMHLLHFNALKENKEQTEESESILALYAMMQSLQSWPFNMLFLAKKSMCIIQSSMPRLWLGRGSPWSLLSPPTVPSWCHVPYCPLLVSCPGAIIPVLLLSFCFSVHFPKPGLLWHTLATLLSRWHGVRGQKAASTLQHTAVPAAKMEMAQD